MSDKLDQPLAAMSGVRQVDYARMEAAMLAAIRSTDLAICPSFQAYFAMMSRPATVAAPGAQAPILLTAASPTGRLPRAIAFLDKESEIAKEAN